MAPVSRSRIVVTRSTSYGDDGNVGRGRDGDCENKVLNLMMISCEENPPYGPARATATMFIELLCAAYERRHQSTAATAAHREHKQRLVILITIYHAQSMDYPQTPSEWDSYHGIIIPGSLSAAYDTHVEWIHRLLTVIQTEIHEKQRKTLGVCFGHQCFAHSFQLQMQNTDNPQQAKSTQDKQGGLATLCSVGPIAGRRPFKLTREGQLLLGCTTPLKDQVTDHQQYPRECLEMLYTRGDMVHSLPSVGISLCGNEDLPNEICAYFASEEDVAKFYSHAKGENSGSDISWRRKSVFDSSSDAKLALPYAITFQAHPEYTTPTGTKVNYVNTVKAMEGRGFISKETCQEACEELKHNYETLSRDSLDAIISAGVLLGWFD